MPTRIVVDSTADIPRERAQQLGVEIVPQTVLFGDEAFLDGVELDGPAFYRKLATSRATPTTAAPSPGLFEEAYRRLIAGGATAILSLHEAAELSSTFANARSAAETVSSATGVPIDVIDSRSVSAGFGLPAELVAARAHSEDDRVALKSYAESLCSRMRLIAVLDTLEYLQRGGRIGPARALLGTVLRMKPLLEVRDGQVLPVANIRTREKAYERLGEIVASLGELEAVAVVESNPEAGAHVRAVIEPLWKAPVESFPLGPVVGTHAGPGAAGIAVIVKER